MVLDGQFDSLILVALVSSRLSSKLDLLGTSDIGGDISEIRDISDIGGDISDIRDTSDIGGDMSNRDT